MAREQSTKLRLAAFVYLAGIVIFTLFHLLLMAGAPLGAFTMGGAWSGSLPVQGRLVSAVSIAVLWALAWPVAAEAGLAWRKPPSWAIYATLAYQILAVVLHIITPSPLERLLWLPLVLLMTAAAALVTWLR